jgi:hypothetical protein
VSRSAGSVFRSFSFFVRCRGDGDAAEGSGGMSDRTLTCRDCGQAFTFTAGEQAFYAERGFSEPQRCPSCRSARKAQRASQGYDSGYGGVVVVAAEAIPPADIAEADRTPRAVAVTRPAVAGIHPVAVGATPADRARCIRRSARNVVGIPRSPSSLARTSRSIAGSASSCGGRRRPRATTTTRTRSSPERGGHSATPFSRRLPA